MEYTKKKIEEMKKKELIGAYIVGVLFVLVLIGRILFAIFA